MIRLHDTIASPQFFDPAKIAHITQRKTGGGSYITLAGIAEAIPVNEPMILVMGLMTLWKNRDKLREDGLLASEDPMMAAAFDEDKGYHFIYAEWGAQA